MSDEKTSRMATASHLGCFGEYDAADRICNHFCALRLRCAIEHDQNARLEVIEDLIAYDNMVTKPQ